MADLDLAELRRKAQRHSRGMARGTAYWPAVVLQLLDRLEAAEARTVELVNELDDERVAYAELLAERDPRAELVQVGWGGCVGHSTCEVDEGHEWYLRHLDDKHELDRTHPIWPVYALRAVPGAVAGEPESTPAAELPFRSYPEFLRRFLPEEAERRRRAGMTPSEVAQEIGREAAAQVLAAFFPAENTPAAEPRCTCETWRRCAIATGASDAAALRWTCPTHGEQRHPRAADTQEAP